MGQTARQDSSWEMGHLYQEYTTPTLNLGHRLVARTTQLQTAEVEGAVSGMEVGRREEKLFSHNTASPLQN